MKDIKEEVEKINQAILKCRKCPLYKTRINPVPGEGSYRAKIMLVGEAPGENEDRTGRPFCGAAGKILDELLDSVGIKRQDVFIANILKCRPPGNRDPKPEEVSSCSGFLEAQIRLIKPKVICTLGNYSTRFIFEKYGLKEKLAGISKLHGKVFRAGDLFSAVVIIPLYHPAVATYNPNMKQVLLEDFASLENFK